MSSSESATSPISITLSPRADSFVSSPDLSPEAKVKHQIQLKQNILTMAQKPQSLREHLFEIMAGLRQRKCRPERETIASSVMKKFGYSNSDEIYNELEKIVDENLLIKVEYKGKLSYRTPEGFDKKNSPLLTKHSKILNSTRTTRLILTTVNDILYKNPNYSTQGIPIEELLSNLLEIDSDRFAKDKVDILLDREYSIGNLKTVDLADDYDSGATNADESSSGKRKGAGQKGKKKQVPSVLTKTIRKIFPKDLKIPENLAKIAIAISDSTSPSSCSIPDARNRPEKVTLAETAAEIVVARKSKPELILSSSSIKDEDSSADEEDEFEGDEDINLDEEEERTSENEQDGDDKHGVNNSKGKSQQNKGKKQKKGARANSNNIDSGVASNDERTELQMQSVGGKFIEAVRKTYEGRKVPVISPEDQGNGNITSGRRIKKESPIKKEEEEKTLQPAVTSVRSKRETRKRNIFDPSDLDTVSAPKAARKSTTTTQVPAAKQRTSRGSATATSSTPTTTLTTTTRSGAGAKKSEVKAKPKQQQVVCEYCQSLENVNNEMEEFLICTTCSNSIHPSCMDYTYEMAERIRKTKLRLQWKCYTCKICEVCNKKINFTDENTKKLGSVDSVLCTKCDGAHHLKCLKVNSKSELNKNWTCSSCTPASKVTSTPPSRRGERKKGRASLAAKKLELDKVEIDPPILENEAEKVNAEPETQEREQPQLTENIEDNDVAITESVDEENANTTEEMDVTTANDVMDTTTDATSVPHSNDSNIATQVSTSLEQQVSSTIPDASNWTPDDVESYFASKGLQEEGSTFKEQEINGLSLLLMRRADVIFGLRLRLGPALKVHRLIYELQTRIPHKNSTNKKKDGESSGSEMVEGVEISK